MSEKTPERIPLTGREYYALREMFGLISCYGKSLGYLEKRAKTLPGVWRDMHMISAKTERVIAALLSTVPTDKLRQIERELENTYVSVEVRRTVIAQPEREMFTYVPQKPLEALIEGVLRGECMFCEKDQRESKKCPWRKAIEATYPYELPEVYKEHCRFSGFTIDEELEVEGLDDGE